MSATTSIEWTDKTWNPVTGCTKVSPGCAHCYAETIAKRLWPTQYPVVVERVGDRMFGRLVGRPREFGDVQCHDDRLLEPLSWKKPARVFVNSMSDLFHEDVPFAFVDKVFAVMASAPQHTFQILTKRPLRMLHYVSLASRSERVSVVAGEREFYSGRKSLADCGDLARAIRSRWPLPNVWLGPSIENQKFADQRFPIAAEIGEAGWNVMVSMEPLLEAVTIPERFLKLGRGAMVIIGGESGHGARPFRLEWPRSIIRQCQHASVWVFMKQLGAVVHLPTTGKTIQLKGKNGDPAFWPEDLRVREVPTR